MRTTAVFIVLAAVLLIAVPPYLGLGWQNTLTSMLTASLFAAAFNLLMGQGGMLSFGHSAFYGIGAFAVLHLMKAVEGGPPFPTLLLPPRAPARACSWGCSRAGSRPCARASTSRWSSLALAELLHCPGAQLGGGFRRRVRAVFDALAVARHQLRFAARSLLPHAWLGGGELGAAVHLHAHAVRTADAGAARQ